MLRSGIMLGCITFSSTKIFSIVFCGTFITQRIRAKIQSIIVTIYREMAQSRMIIVYHEVWIKMYSHFWMRAWWYHRVHTVRAKLHATFLSLLLVLFTFKWVVKYFWRRCVLGLSIEVTLGNPQRKIFSLTSFVLQTCWTQWLKEGPQALCHHIINCILVLSFVFEVHTSASKEREQESEARAAEGLARGIAQEAVPAPGTALPKTSASTSTASP